MNQKSMNQKSMNQKSMNQKSINTIPMVDVQAWHRPIQAQLEKKALEVLRSAVLSWGKKSRFLSRKPLNTSAPGTPSAVPMVPMRLFLHFRPPVSGQGMRYYTTGFTFFATAEAIMQSGATPVLVDIDSETFNIDPVELEGSITSRCRAVLLVHLFGLPAALSEIQAVCDRHGLILLEDCAQSFGASYHSRKTGNFGLLGAFSFFPSKNLGGFGDGGLVITSQLKAAETVRKLRNHGSS